MTRELRLDFARGTLAHLSALWDEPARGVERRTPCLLAHGAGGAMRSPFLERVAAGLVARGFPVLRFHYPYRERALAAGKRTLPPDPAPVLEGAHRAALERLVAIGGDPRPLLVGKSLGGRIGTHLAAKDAPCRGLVLLGYPLHPPGRPERLRDEHFAAIAQPALFLQGTRDALCDLDLLRRSLARFGGRATLEVVDGADHGFVVPRGAGRTSAAVQDDLVERIDRWHRATFPE